jgi:hypothetical protein
LSYSASEASEKSIKRNKSRYIVHTCIVLVVRPRDNISLIKVIGFSELNVQNLFKYYVASYSQTVAYKQTVILNISFEIDNILLYH